MAWATTGIIITWPHRPTLETVTAWFSLVGLPLLICEALLIPLATVWAKYSAAK